jgi:hypothetical protein
MVEETKEVKVNKPDYKGFIEVAGWLKTAENGNKFITIKISQYCELYQVPEKK